MAGIEDRYTLEGEGSRAGDLISYEGADTDGRRVLVREWSPERGADAGEREAFASLARASLGVTHPNLAAVIEVVDEAERLAVVTEDFDGEDLTERLDAGPLKPSSVVPMMLQILSALAAVHEAGLVHGCVNPAAVRLGADGGAHLMDLGVWDAQRALSPDALAYMAPEQLAGGELSPVSDLFSAGALLYRMLSGLQPFQGADAAGIAAAVANTTPPPLDEAAGPALAAVVAHALQKEPAARFASAEDFARELMLAPLPGASTAPPAPKRRAMQPVLAWLSGPGRFVVGGVVIALVAAGIGVGAVTYQNRTRASERSRVLSEAEAVTITRNEAYVLRKELQATLAGVKTKAARNKSEVTAWDNSWRTRLDQYQARLREVQDHNDTERTRYAQSKVTYTQYDWWGWPVGSYDVYTYTPSYWSDPKYPGTPDPVRTNLKAELAALQETSTRIRSLKTSVDARFQTLSCFGPAASDLTVLIGTLASEADTDTALVQAMLVRGKEGDTIDQSRAARLVADEDATALSALEKDLAFLYQKYQLNPAGYAVKEPAEVSKDASVSVSPELRGFNPGWLCDGKGDTCWSVEATGGVLGQSVRFDLGRPAQVARISVFTGRTKGADLKAWSAVPRPKKLKIEFSDKTAETVELRDKASVQNIELVQARSTRWLKVTVVEVYPGTKSQSEVALGELRLWGYR